METNYESDAVEFIFLAWRTENLNSYQRLNSIMYETVEIAVKANMKFHIDDFLKILEKCRGGYWFGVSTNGKGLGEGFYRTAKEYNNVSAMQAYENFRGIKAFILKNKRITPWDYLMDDQFAYQVTGYNDALEITLVAYEIDNFPGKHNNIPKSVKRKLLKFNNTEWLDFRKTAKEF